MGLAWRSATRMNRLQLRLLRASEMNAHLQELNIAAAGLAHETRNPLNIVRGLAQLISQSPGLSPGIRQKSNEITEEVDRVTGRLNEFITYSRSPEPRPAPTRLLAVVGDVQRTLGSDLAEKAIHCETRGPDLVVEADESLLRQVIFNLLLNAIQAVGQDGRVEVIMQHNGRGEAAFEVRDNGPGVPIELRPEIFKPYFTTRPEGTGMGLAVVRQIVMAHHWDLEYIAGPDGGAGFRVSGLKAS
jgi:signal transduction histidine kinase